MKLVADRIKKYRRIRGMTLAELSEGICAVSTLHRIETGKHYPQLDTLFLLSSKLRIPIKYLINSDDHNEVRYIHRIKQLCREFVNNEEWKALNQLLIEAHQQTELDLEKHEEFRLFINWHKAIYTHRCLKDPLQAKKIINKTLPLEFSIISETDIGIANSIGLIHLEQHKYNKALHLFKNCLHAIDQLPVLEDKLLFVRVGYNYSLTNYYLQNYLEVVDIGYKLIYFSDLHKLIYLGGRVNHLLGITFEKKNNLTEAEKHMRKASEIFLVESNQRLYLRALRALSEIQFKASKMNEGINTLNKVESQLAEIQGADDLLRLVTITKEKYLTNGAS